jgi:hypothetical protein
MLEDDLRHFPMATTDYLQKIRVSKRYQNIVRLDALKATAKRLNSPLNGFYFITQPVDRYGYGLHMKIIDILSNRYRFSYGLVDFMESCPNVIFIERGGHIIHSRLLHQSHTLLCLVLFWANGVYTDVSMSIPITEYTY